MQTILAISVLFLLGLLGVQLIVARQFRGRILGLVARLHDSPIVSAPQGSLPTMVADFARRSGAEANEKIRLASLHQSGELRLKPGGRFARFSAWQVTALGRAGFVWDARQGGGPLVGLHVVDSYIGTKGLLEARLFGSIPVAQKSGPDIDLAEAFRYLAELPWAPDAILGNPDLEWRVTGPSSAEVRLPTKAGTARVTFSFDAAGDIVGMHAKDRPATDPSGQPTQYDWQGRYWDYAEVGDRRIPRQGEVGYVYPSGYEPYFRVQILDYHLAS